MGKVKPWQIAVIVLGLLVGIGSMTWSFTGVEEVKLPHRSFMVDVETGTIFDVDTSKRAVMVPGKHPDTGRYSLLGVQKDEHGEWIITERDASLMGQLNPDVKIKAVDPNTGKLTVPAQPPVPYRFS